MYKNQEIFSIEKWKNSFFFHFFYKKELKYYFKIKDFFEVLYTSVGQKIKMLENHPDSLTFSANTPDHF